MRISSRYGFAFLCTPKCASTSIEEAISGTCNIRFGGHPNIKHIDAETFTSFVLAAHKQLLPSKVIESFCLIREPVEWIESWYRFRMKEVFQRPNHPNFKNYTGNIDFNDFVAAVIANGVRPAYANLSTQYDFVTLANGEIGLDYIFPMERLDLISEFLTRKIRMPIEIPVRNVSPKVPVQLDPELEGELRRYLRRDIALYDFVKAHGVFKKALHSDELAAALAESMSPGDEHTPKTPERVSTDNKQ